MAPAAVEYKGNLIESTNSNLEKQINSEEEKQLNTVGTNDRVFDYRLDEKSVRLKLLKGAKRPPIQIRKHALT